MLHIYNKFKHFFKFDFGQKIEKVRYNLDAIHVLLIQAMEIKSTVTFTFLSELI